MSQPQSEVAPRSLCLIAVGSNQPREGRSTAQTVATAIIQTGDEDVSVISQSRLFSTPAFPAGSGPDYVNACFLVETALAPKALLHHLHRVEASFGRLREERWGSRTIDLDLLSYGVDLHPSRDVYEYWKKLPIVDQPRIAPDQLILPHPRLAERAFVLVPLMDIAPAWRHPVTGQSVREMLEALPKADIEAVRPLQDA